MTPPPDLLQAERFLALLDPEGVFTFQSFADSDDVRRDGRLAQVFHGTLSTHADALGNLNSAGAGIFVMVNAGDGTVRSGSRTCRTAANVIRVRALFVDLDGAPISPVITSELPPDWVVQSSPERWHAYWQVDDCPHQDFGAAQAALAKRFDGDASVKDLPRVMRVPGFVHRKDAPFLSQLYLPAEYHRIQGARHE